MSKIKKVKGTDQSHLTASEACRRTFFFKKEEYDNIPEQYKPKNCKVYKQPNKPMKYKHIRGQQFMGVSKEEMANHICFYEDLLRTSNFAYIEERAKNKILERRLSKLGYNPEFDLSEIKEYQIDMQCALESNLAGIMSTKYAYHEEVRKRVSFMLSKYLRENESDCEAQIISLKMTLDRFNEIEKLLTKKKLIKDPLDNLSKLTQIYKIKKEINESIRSIRMEANRKGYALKEDDELNKMGLEAIKINEGNLEDIFNHLSESDED